MNIVLHTPHLTLRPISTADLKTVFAYAGAPENARYMLFLPYDSQKEAAETLARMEEKMRRIPAADYFFAIERNRAHIGEISLEISKNAREAELGWILHRNFWGQGLATEAAFAVRDFAFQTLGLQKLFAHCDARNIGSARVMEHIGMSLEATGARRNRMKNEISAEYKYSLYNS